MCCCEEFFATMHATMHNIEFDQAVDFPIRTFEFVGLVDRHLWVLITVK